MKTWGDQFQQTQLQNTLAPKAQETLQKKRWRYYKSQRTREFAVSLCLLVMSEFILLNFHQPDQLNMSWTSQQQKTSQSGWGKATRPRPYTKNYRQPRKAERKTVFHREEHTNYLSSSKWSALKRDVWITLYRPSMFYLVACVCVCNNSLWKKEAMNLKESKEGYVGVWREER